MTRRTCGDYRREMILLGLRRQMAEPQISEEQKERLRAQIRELEVEMGME